MVYERVSLFTSNSMTTEGYLFTELPDTRLKATGENLYISLVLMKLSLWK